MVSVNLFVPNCEEAVKFYCLAFGAIVKEKKFENNATIRVGDDIIYIVKEDFQNGRVSPVELGAASLGIHLLVDNVLKWEKQPDGGQTVALVSGVKSFVENAIKSGCEYCYPSSEQNPIFLNSNLEYCTIKDKYGFIWIIGQIPKEKQFQPPKIVPETHVYLR